MHERVKLFFTDNLFGVESEVVNHAKHRARSHSYSAFKDNSLDVLAETIAKDFELEPLRFDVNSVQLVERRHVPVHYQDGFGSTSTADGIEVKVSWDVGGDPRLWHCQPTTFNLGNPGYVIELSDSQIFYTDRFALSSLNEGGFDPKIEEFAKFVQTNVTRINADVERINKGIQPSVRHALQERLAQLERYDSVITASKIPVVQRDQPAVSVPVKPSVLQIRNKPKLAEPISGPQFYLAPEDFEGIIDVVRQVTLAIERSPAAFERLKEEHIRDIILVFLNGYFRGRAGGETFNVKGKTDILINENGKNVFIAECKFWSGPEGFAGAVDQILGYLGWRDTRALLLVFNKNKDSTRSLRVARETLKQHPDFLRERQYSEDNLELKCVLKRQDDDLRHIFLTTMMISIPD